MHKYVNKWKKGDIGYINGFTPAEVLEIHENNTITIKYLKKNQAHKKGEIKRYNRAFLQSKQKKGIKK